MSDELKQVLKKIEDRNADLAEKSWAAIRVNMTINELLEMIRRRTDPEFDSTYSDRREFDTQQEAIEYAMLAGLHGKAFKVVSQEIGKPRRVS